MHIFAVEPLERHIEAKKYLAKNKNKSCICDLCEVPTDPLEKARAELACKIACQRKCPRQVTDCPLVQFADEDYQDYVNRCNAAKKLALSIDSVPEPEEIIPGREDPDEFEVVVEEEDTYSDDFNDPEDEW